MSYQVRWFMKEPEAIIVDPIRYPRIFNAEHFAFTILRLKPTAIWIEDEKGNVRADKQAIEDEYRRRVRK
jgi:hypothetical protein